MLSCSRSVDSTFSSSFKYTFPFVILYFHSTKYAKWNEYRVDFCCTILSKIRLRSDKIVEKENKEKNVWQDRSTLVRKEWKVAERKREWAENFRWKIVATKINDEVECARANAHKVLTRKRNRTVKKLIR